MFYLSVDNLWKSCFIIMCHIKVNFLYILDLQHSCIDTIRLVLYFKHCYYGIALWQYSFVCLYDIHVLVLYTDEHTLDLQRKPVLLTNR